MKKNIKIAIVHEMLCKMGGAERVLDSLQKIFPNAPIYTLLYDEKKCGNIFPKEKIKTSHLQKFLDWGVPRQFLVRKMPQAIEEFDFSGFDIVISSSSAFAHGIITPSHIPHICYVHAPMRYVWDYTHKYRKEKTSGWKKFLHYPLLSLMHTLRIWDYSASSRPDILLANSKTTQKRIQKFWRKNAEVITPPVQTEKFSQSIKISQKNDYYFIVSALEPFKKIDIVIQAFAQKNFSHKKLIIIGEGSDEKNLKTLAHTLGAKNIKFLGRKSDEEVLQYMKNGKALIFPGLEDFGITPVEAMACGKPVIFYNKGGVSESVIPFSEKNKKTFATGIGFEKQTSESLAQAIEKFETDEIQAFFTSTNIVQHIKSHADKFSEKIFQKKIKEIVQKALLDNEL